MKIIKQGKLPENNAEFKGKCRLCGCEIVADKAEIKSGYSGMDAQHGFYVDCPTEGCKRQIDMKEVVHRGGQ